MPSPFPPASLVAAYFRDSGGDTQDLSIAQQRQRFLDWCTLHHLAPGKVFVDQAKPGSTTANRTAFHDMIHHFHNNPPEAGLVIWSYSRFSRDFDDAQFYRADLRRRGYLFHSLNDDIPSGSIGRLFEAAIDWKNEQFLEDLSRDVKRGLASLVTNYGAVPGTPPRGFMRQPITIGKHRDGRDHIAHRWVPDPAVTPLVKLAFKLRAIRLPLSHIHQQTHLYGSLNSYGTFFANKIYIGILEYSDLVFPNYCEPIVDQPTWQAVQAILAEHAQNANLKTIAHPRRVASHFLLSGLAYCARCQSPLQGHSSSQRTTTPIQSYYCTRAKRRRDCDFRPVPRQVLEASVLDQLINHILLPNIIAEQQRQHELVQTQYLAELQALSASLNQTLAATRRRIANLTNAIAEAGHNPALLAKLHDHQVQETTILGQLAELDHQMSPSPAITPDQLPAIAEHLRRSLETADLPEAQAILRGLIQKIHVDRTDRTITGEIIYYMPPPLPTDHPP